MKKADVKLKVEELICLLDGDKRRFKETETPEELFTLLKTMIKYIIFDLEATRRELKGKK